MNYTVDYNRYVNTDVFGGFLPSAYVECAEPSQKSNGIIGIKGEVVVYEKRESGSSDSLWYTNDVLKGFITLWIKIKITLNSGTVSYIDIEKELYKDEDLAMYIFERLIDGTEIYKISYDFDSTQYGLNLSDIKSMSINAYTQLDTEEIESKYGVEFPYTGFIGLFTSIGHMDTKEVWLAGAPVLYQTGHFTEEGKIWLGPTHTHTRGGRSVVMAGKTHSPTESHPTLTVEQISNYVTYGSAKEEIERIIDFSIDDQINNLLGIQEKTLRSSYSNIVTNAAYFSNLHLTRAKDDKMCAFFTIDYDNLVIQNSLYGSIYALMNNNIKRMLLNNATLYYFEVQRVRKDLETAPEVIALAADSNGFSDVPRLKRVNVGSASVKTFLISDATALENKRGQFAYKIILKIFDPIYSFFADFYNELSGVITALENYYNQSGIATNYDYSRNTFNRSYFRTLMSADYTGVRYWEEAKVVIDIFFDSFKFDISNIASKSLTSLSDTVYNYLNPETATLDSIQSTIEIFQSIYSNMQNFVQHQEPDLNNKTSLKSSQNASLNSIQIEHEFDLYDIRDYDSFVKFIDISDSSSFSISLQDYVEQYYEDAGTYITTTKMFVPDSSFSFFSLQRVKIGQSAFDLSSWTASNFRELGVMYNFDKTGKSFSFESGFSDSEAASYLSLSGISIVEQEEMADTVTNSKDIVGKNSKASKDAGKEKASDFNKATSTDAPELSKDLIKVLPIDQNVIAIYSVGDAETNSTQSESLYTALTETSAITPTYYNSLSLAYKANTNSDTFKTEAQGNKFVIYLKYATMGRIEYLSNPTTDVKNPVWSRLTKSDISNATYGSSFLCRVRRIVSSGYMDDTSPRVSSIFDYNILNEYFVLNIDDISLPSAATYFSSGGGADLNTEEPATDAPAQNWNDLKDQYRDGQDNGTMTRTPDTNTNDTSNGQGTMRDGPSPGGEINTDEGFSNTIATNIPRDIDYDY